MQLLLKVQCLAKEYGIYFAHGMETNLLNYITSEMFLVTKFTGQT